VLTKFWNPYLEKYMATVGSVLPTYGEEHYTNVLGNFDTFANVFQARDKCLKEYSFAVPSQEAIDALVHYGPVVEIGCGLGYWAKLVQDAGGEIIPYDSCVNDQGMVKLYMTKSDYAPAYTQVFQGGVEVAELHSDKTLFLCWPPYDSPMAHDCLETYLKHGGKTLIYVGEGHGGCTGDDEFHNLIEERLECVKTISIPVWPGIHDYMNVYTLKSAQ
jgi:hypothetical protein